jgi:hypothetical protein
VCGRARARAHITTNAQVLWSYGQRSNDDFLAYHGFVLPDNPDDDAALWDSAQQLAAWAAQQQHQLPALRGLGPGQQLQQRVAGACVCVWVRARVCVCVCGGARVCVYVFSLCGGGGGG